MIAELESAQKLFDQADRALEAVVAPFAAKAGVTIEQVEALVAELTVKAQADG
jgi:hypothetical protein